MMSPGEAEGNPFGVIREFIAAHGKFLLLTHIGPDGDGLLASVALSRYLHAKGKQATVVIEGASPNFLGPYDPEGLVRTREELLAHENWAEGFDAALAVDTGKPERLGRIRHAVAASGLPVGVIDHHIREEGDFDGPAAIDTGASAVGLMIAEFFEEEGYAFDDPIIVRALFATLSYDTGHFRYTNTSAKTLQWASRLMDLGARPTETYSIFWESNSAASIKLLGHLMINLKIECGGRLGWFAMSIDDLEKFGVRREETEEYISVPRSVGSLEIIAYFSALEKNLIRVSLRSKGRVGIYDVAVQFGGGGHAFAAGARVKDTLEKSAQAVTKALAETIRKELGPD